MVILLDVSRLQFEIKRVAFSKSEHDVAILTRDSRTVNGFCFNFQYAVTRDKQTIPSSQQGDFVQSRTKYGG